MLSLAVPIPVSVLFRCPRVSSWWCSSLQFSLDMHDKFSPRASKNQDCHPSSLWKLRNISVELFAWDSCLISYRSYNLSFNSMLSLTTRLKAQNRSLHPFPQVLYIISFTCTSHLQFLHDVAIGAKTWISKEKTAPAFCKYFQASLLKWFVKLQFGFLHDWMHISKTFFRRFFPVL